MQDQTFFYGNDAEFDEDSESGLGFDAMSKFLTYDKNKVTIEPKLKNDHLNY